MYEEIIVGEYIRINSDTCYHGIPIKTILKVVKVSSDYTVKVFYNNLHFFVIYKNYEKVTPPTDNNVVIEVDIEDDIEVGDTVELLKDLHGYRVGDIGIVAKMLGRYICVLVDGRITESTHVPNVLYTNDSLKLPELIFMEDCQHKRK